MPMTIANIPSIETKNSDSVTKNTRYCVCGHCTERKVDVRTTKTSFHNKGINVVCFSKSRSLLKKVDSSDCDTNRLGNNNVVKRNNFQIFIHIFTNILNNVLSTKISFPRSPLLPSTIHAFAAFILITLSIFISLPFILISAEDIPAPGEDGNSETNLGIVPHSNPNQVVDLTRLFSDVSRTVSGIGTILRGTSSRGNSSPQLPQSDPSVEGESIDRMPSSDGTYRPEGKHMGEAASSLPFVDLLGGSNVCFKACGMEDIQYAARRAGEMFSTTKVCMVILTTVIALCALMLTAAAIFYLLSQKVKSRNRGTNKEKNSTFLKDNGGENVTFASTCGSSRVESSNFDEANCASPSFFSTTTGFRGPQPTRFSSALNSHNSDNNSKDTFE